ncbi:adenylosuccinate lyase [Riemerella anatipestifer]|uniref:Adenylosuccinate lyase n=1 Tax=Riemerella anatipestifer (strain ATCC 11845 / DSM 15868 / JCM 9532 / NCTC 11014) TaxID=693978 RepID=E4T979_RIEAD|nr:adenylosuccinate lyase [Riemerella anatipestifer]ADQ81560.1 adenylosuccinate lyase [Riemerella anatipestifer ATCC 11845 = DSM 15868]AFD55580.1 adenylosuccinate lyase [Riemerella anatipestifer ATCC 11845 = DSM 15868]MRM91848.1 adenylosuccinate lyase [Riemerella anatipestifer]MRN05156.1 adenylosuccinate lyase [Riemerella anatipestifer]MSN91332.1 adenylosuccinate lyase [Riemerella anatipestifer]
MNTYKNPLEERYSSEEMLFNFSHDNKFQNWRKLWIALAEIEKDLGLDISEEQINQMKNKAKDIDYTKAAEYEKRFRHDVMAHVHTYGDVAPLAKPIIHLGATSAFVGDNTDLIQMRDGLLILKKKLVNVIKGLSDFALKYKDLPTLGFTHFQPAQLTTVGKRATLWLQSLILDFEELEFFLDTLRFRGVKGTTGTAASFLELFNGDYEKVKTLDKELSKRFGFDKVFGVSGQTYDRKIDAKVVALLSNIAQSAHKFTNDLRLLQNLKEIEEPFEKDQIGSSAMAYKRNPMRSERIGALAKYVMSLSSSSAMVAATQWFERTLDDSANKRLSIPQAFLAVDAILLIWNNIMNGLVVYENRINKHIMEELPFMATEYIIMEEVKAGGDRQEIHEIIRVHSMEASKKVKMEGKDNDLIERIMNDNSLKLDKSKLAEVLDPKNFIGFAPIQTEEFIKNEVQPILDKYSDMVGLKAELKV